MNKKRYEQTKQNELHDVQIIDKNISINLSDLLLARLFDHSCKFAHTRCYSEKRASFWLEVGAVGMFGSWQTACGYNANIPMGKVSRERRRSRSSVSREFGLANENRPGQKRTRADKTRELAGNEGSSGDSCPGEAGSERGQKHELVTTSLFLHRDFLGDLVRSRSPCSSIVF